jgi:glycosyltransferase involved in cell wall biosynthesis
MSIVSVVVPTYNRPEYLRQSVQSLRNQTVKDIEIIVVDDASRGGWIDQLKKDPLFTDVTFLRHESNRGPGESRRTGVRAAQGRYIAFLDDDDLLEPECLEKAIDVLTRNPGVGLFCCDGLLIDREGQASAEKKTFNGGHAAIHGYPLRSGLRTLGDVFLWPTVGIGFVARREVFERVNYPVERWLEDYRFQLDVAGSGFQVYYLHEPLARYRMHDGNASAPSPAMCEEMVVCLQAARKRFPSLRALGWRARRRMAQARMDAGVASLRVGELGHGIARLFRAVVDYPPQGLVFMRLVGGWMLKRAA